jgi:hypothetical protein
MLKKIGVLGLVVLIILEDKRVSWVGFEIFLGWNFYNVMDAFVNSFVDVDADAGYCRLALEMTYLFLYRKLFLLFLDI